MAKNIEMNYYNGSAYEVLYPQTLLNNVENWEQNIYSKTQIDSKFNSVNNEINNIVSGKVFSTWTRVYTKTVTWNTDYAHIYSQLTSQTLVPANTIPKGFNIKIETEVKDVNITNITWQNYREDGRLSIVVNNQSVGSIFIEDGTPSYSASSIDKQIIGYFYYFGNISGYDSYLPPFKTVTSNNSDILFVDEVWRTFLNNNSSLSASIWVSSQQMAFQSFNFSGKLMINIYTSPSIFKINA